MAALGDGPGDVRSQFELVAEEVVLSHRKLEFRLRRGLAEFQRLLKKRVYPGLVLLLQVRVVERPHLLCRPACLQPEFRITDTLLDRQIERFDRLVVEVAGQENGHRVPIQPRIIRKAREGIREHLAGAIRLKRVFARIRGIETRQIDVGGTVIRTDLDALLQQFYRGGPAVIVQCQFSGVTRQRGIAGISLESAPVVLQRLAHPARRFKLPGGGVMGQTLSHGLGSRACRQTLHLSQRQIGTGLASVGPLRGGRTCQSNEHSGAGDNSNGPPPPLTGEREEVPASTVEAAAASIQSTRNAGQVHAWKLIT